MTTLPPPQRGFVAPSFARPAQESPAPGKTLLGVIPRSVVLNEVQRVLQSRAVTPGPKTTPGDGPSRQAPMVHAAVAPPLATGTSAGKVIVSTYRLLGFGILTLIVVVLVGYIATTAFYFLSRSWVMPTVVSPSDEKVVARQAELAAHQNQRDRMAGELADADRAAAAEQAFQLEFARAIQSDLAGRQAALGRIQKLAATAAATRGEIRRANESYARSSADRMATDYTAGLIDQHAMLAGRFQLAQISSSSLAVAERQAELEQQAAELATSASGLDALLANRAATGGVSYDVLRIKRDYDTSRLALARALGTRKTLAAAIEREQQIITGLEQSAYLRAIADHAVVAVVPYDNLGTIAPGAKLYGCRVGMVVCHEVGSVLEVLPGEVSFKHPHRDTQLRGKMIEMRLDDAEAAQRDVLFVGGAPLWL